MNLQISGLLLVVALFPSSSALTPDECKPLQTPLSLDHFSETWGGRWNSLAAYASHDAFGDALKGTESSWVNINQTAKANEADLIQENRINGTCVFSSSRLVIEGNTGLCSVANVSSQFQLLPSCTDCLVMSINTTGRNLDTLLQKMHYSSSGVTAEEYHIHSLYLMARGSSLQDSDLEKFKQQASCFGFSGEPEFHYDPKNEFCAEGEGVKVVL
ncbi:uncharacterized protein LOC131984616 [Centropristis striata]|uniref:uncharacterized protein LOC131984616 n=1 Tax=Centropristis striata TaxID=184440 RepID=UPI0027E051E4|nr:uncharacterized protein LOC131984616 [Centropristis striata]